MMWSDPGKPDFEHDPRFVTGVINGSTYINTFLDNASEKEHDRESGISAIYKYRVTGDQLEVWEGDKRASDELTARGILEKSSSGGMVETRPVAGLLNYLRTNPGDDLFPIQNRLVYHRVPGTGMAPPAPVAPTAPTPAQSTTPSETKTVQPTPVATPAAELQQSGPSFWSVIPWVALAFIAGIYMAQKFKKPKT